MPRWVEPVLGSKVPSTEREPTGSEGTRQELRAGRTAVTLPDSSPPALLCSCPLNDRNMDQGAPGSLRELPEASTEKIPTISSD